MKNFIPAHAICFYDASVTLGLDAKEFDARLVQLEGKIDQATKRMSGRFSGLGSSLSGALGFLSVGAISAAAKGLTDYGAQVYDLSTRFGVSTDAIQHFGRAAEQNGSSMEAMAKGFRFLEVARSKALKGDNEMVDAFQRLGISVQDLATLKPEELMTKLGASSLNASDTVKILGRSALELRPTLGGIADGTIKFEEAIKKIDIDRLKQAQVQFEQIKNSVTIIGATLLTSVGHGIADFGKKIGDSGREAGQVAGRVLARTLHFRDALQAGMRGDMKSAHESLTEMMNVGKGAATPITSESDSLEKKMRARPLSQELDELERKMRSRGPEVLDKSKVKPFVPAPKRDYGEEDTRLTVGQSAAAGAAVSPFEWGSVASRQAERNDRFGESALDRQNAARSAAFSATFSRGMEGMSKGAAKDPVQTAVEGSNKLLDKIESNTRERFVNK